jgi:hypothetical protein
VDRRTREQRTQDEIEAGKRAVALYGKLEKVDTETKKLSDAFPRLTIAAVLNKPYDHVTVRARPQFLAPIESLGVLSENYSSESEVTFIDPIDDYPTNHLVARLALIS